VTDGELVVVARGAPNRRGAAGLQLHPKSPKTEILKQGYFVDIMI
jgi:hypothetical protein